MAISKSTIIENIWKEFYDRLKAQVISVDITGGDTITVQNYVSSFPDQLLDSKSEYPILVVETPKISTESFSMKTDKYEGSISIDIYTNQAESADKFLSSMIDAIESHRRTLKLSGLSMVDLDSTDTDKVSRDAIKIHMRTAIFKFSFLGAKTLVY